MTVPKQTVVVSTVALLCLSDDAEETQKKKETKTILAFFNSAVTKTIICIGFSSRVTSYNKHKKTIETYPLQGWSFTAVIPK